MRVPALMIQGTGSDVGKSLLLAGLARAFTRRGLQVRPFKPQNMSNNAAVTADGGEIGRAQALQAQACGVMPSVHMNPVLLKPQSGHGAQVVVQGKVERVCEARDYARLKPALMPRVLESFGILGAEADLILVEGAGSPAEVNLRAGDIANMGFAEAADLPVVLVGDIDRGGVIASLVGTCQLLPEAERARLKGYVVNKFRGDVELFMPALDIIEAETGMPCLGILPHWPEASSLPAEDSLSLDNRKRERKDGKLIIAVPRLPFIANFDDLDPLMAEPSVEVVVVPPGQPLPRDADLILLPGSKATLADLVALRHEGWDIDILAHVRAGGRVLGLCGGYQMLGRIIDDPDGLEGPAGGAEGLGLLDIETVLGHDKRLVSLEARDGITGLDIRGYEIHLGSTTGPDAARPLLEIEGRAEGARSADGRVSGCYIHGLFAADGWRRHFLGGIGGEGDATLDYDAMVDRLLDSLAAHVEMHLDMGALLEIALSR
ncbi:MAG TPA: cobyric acid synthase [Stellaceae bacterium]|nr:cobyric acid synthase [Stellaceae bacterium]